MCRTTSMMDAIGGKGLGTWCSLLIGENCTSMDMFLVASYVAILLKYFCEKHTIWILYSDNADHGEYSCNCKRTACTWIKCKLQSMSHQPWIFLQETEEKMAIMHLRRIFGSRQRHRKSTVMKNLPEDFYRQCTRLQSYIMLTFLVYVQVTNLL